MLTCPDEQAICADYSVLTFDMYCKRYYRISPQVAFDSKSESSQIWDSKTARVAYVRRNALTTRRGQLLSCALNRCGPNICGTSIDVQTARFHERVNGKRARALERAQVLSMLDHLHISMETKLRSIFVQRYDQRLNKAQAGGITLPCGSAGLATPHLSIKSASGLHNAPNVIDFIRTNIVLSTEYGECSSFTIVTSGRELGVVNMLFWSSFSEPSASSVRPSFGESSYT